MSSALLIIERNEQILSLLYQENRMIQVKVHENNGKKQVNMAGEDKLSSLPLHAIYIGKVKNVVPSIDAAFVEVEKGKMGFLPMKQAKNPIIVNRKYDGRIVAGDEILVQIEKEGIKTKDPGLTCNLSFTGKYCVLTTGKQNVGFSTKLDNQTKLYWKQQLEEWNMDEVLAKENVGLVVRTNVAGLMENGIDAQSDIAKTSDVCIGSSKFREEFQQLLEQKNKVLSAVSYRTCFSCLDQPMEGYLEDIRDAYEDSFDKIVTNNEVFYRRIRETFPTMENVELYQDTRISLEKLYSIETRLKEALDERVWLNHLAREPQKLKKR